VGRGWAGNRKWLDKILSNFYLKFGFLANFGNLLKEIPKECSHGDSSKNLLGFSRIFRK
jgi:hypothetical protein